MSFNSLSAPASCVLLLLLVRGCSLPFHPNKEQCKEEWRYVPFPWNRAWPCYYSRFPGETWTCDLCVLQPRFAVPAGLCCASGMRRSQCSLFPALGWCLEHPGPGLWSPPSFDLPWEVPLSWWGCFDVFCSLPAKSFCWRCSAELLSS